MSKLEISRDKFFDELRTNSQVFKFWSNERIEESHFIIDENYGALANVCRLNALTMIAYAGSGHIGTSFSAAEVITLIKGISSYEDSKLHAFLDCQFFSSKGHDAPMIYAALHAFGQLTDEDIFKFRRAKGLEGHPIITTPGIITNTGSLGMGISKAKGFIYANRISQTQRKVVVLLGDGELQEGQIWESMPGAARDNMHELVVIVDSNKIQSDTWVSDTLDLGFIKDRVESVGWQFLECQGNSISDLSSALEKSLTPGKPTWIHANTRKGAGVSFMENFDADGKFYKFHSGAPSTLEYEIASQEILQKILSRAGYDQLAKVNKEKSIVSNDRTPKPRLDSIVDIYASCLVEIATARSDIFVMDADLSYDTGTYKFRSEYPSRYLQCGIAEQDMASIAGTLALSSLTPIVHSFATFLSMRACEQIFNNATENSTVVYVGFLAGVLPGMPGVSHQAVNDLVLMSSNPNMRLYEPSTEREIQLSLLRATEALGPSYIRMQSIGVSQSESQIELDIGTIWNDGENVILVCSGISMLEQAQKSVEFLKLSNCNISLLTIFDFNALANSQAIDFILKHDQVFVIENSLPGNLLQMRISEILSLSGKSHPMLYRIGLVSLPICGQNNEVLDHHGFSARKITEFVLSKIEIK